MKVFLKLDKINEIQGYLIFVSNQQKKCNENSGSSLTQSFQGKRESAIAPTDPKQLEYIK